MEIGDLVRIRKEHRSSAPSSLRWACAEVLDTNYGLSIVRIVVSNSGFALVPGTQSTPESPHQMEVVFSVPNNMLEVVGEVLQEII